MGPLGSVRIIETVGIGPGPHASLLLADLGAEVIRVDRPLTAKPNSGSGLDPLNADRPSIRIDLKQPGGTAVLLRMLQSADALIEPFRPGVMERLGLGPEVCLRHNPRLVYLRMTGWGQSGPFAGAAGHDINYIALAGALHDLRRVGERPFPPLSLLGDYGGGSMFLIAGLLAGVLHARETGEGQVVDVAMVDGVASLQSVYIAMGAPGSQGDAGPGLDMLQTASPFYDVYETADGKYISVGAIEPPFYAAFMAGLGLDIKEFPRQFDRRHWAATKARVADIIRAKPRAHWEKVFDGTDACVAPVLSRDEAREHPHLAARATFVEYNGRSWGAPAPRFSRTPGALNRPPASPDFTEATLAAAGFMQDEIRSFQADHIVG